MSWGSPVLHRRNPICSGIHVSFRAQLFPSTGGHGGACRLFSLPAAAQLTEALIRAAGRPGRTAVLPAPAGTPGVGGGYGHGRNAAAAAALHPFTLPPPPPTKNKTQKPLFTLLSHGGGGGGGRLQVGDIPPPPPTPCTAPFYPSPPHLHNPIPPCSPFAQFRSFLHPLSPHFAQSWSLLHYCAPPLHNPIPFCTPPHCTAPFPCAFPHILVAFCTPL